MSAGHISVDWPLATLIIVSSRGAQNLSAGPRWASGGDMEVTRLLVVT